MVMSKQPVGILGFFFDFLEEFGQPIRLIVVGFHHSRAGRGAVGDDVVRLPTAPVQIPSGLSVGERLLDSVYQRWTAYFVPQDNLNICLL